MIEALSGTMKWNDWSAWHGFGIIGGILTIALVIYLVRLAFKR